MNVSSTHGLNFILLVFAKIYTYLKWLTVTFCVLCAVSIASRPPGDAGSDVERVDVLDQIEKLLDSDGEYIEL